MSDLDVALRLRLERSGFREGERDIEGLRRATRQFGAERVGRQTGQDLQALGREAKSTGAAFEAAGRNARDLNSKSLDRFRREIGDVDRSAQNMNRRLRETGETAQGLRGAGDAAAFLGRSAGAAWGAVAAFAAPTAILAGLKQLADGFREVDRAAANTALTAEMRDPRTRLELIAQDRAFGRDLGARQSEIQAARGVFVGGNISVADQKTLLPPTLRTAIGAGASAETIASAGRAFVQTMGGRPEDIGAAYDMMAKGSKLGSFELGALARNLPSLGSQYKAAGGSGLQGLSELIALAEVAAKGAGNEDEAANNLSNYLSKLFAPETVKNFKEKRVNLPRLIEQARKEGKHPALAVMDEAQRITKGDPFKMGELFGDMQVNAALRPLMENRQLLNDYQKQIFGSSKGTSDADYNYRLTTPSGREDLEKARRESAQIGIGQTVEPGAAFGSRAYTRATEDAARISSKGFLGGAWEALKTYHPLFGGDFGIAGRYLREPDTEASDVDERAAEVRSIDQRIAQERAAIARSGRKLHWGADSRIGRLENRREELVQGMRSDLSRAEGSRVPEGDAPTMDTQALERRIDALTKALKDLEGTLKVPEGGVNPISFRGEGGVAGIWQASLGRSGGGGSGGGFGGSYSNGPVMDGFGGAAGAAPFMPGGGSVRATSNPGGAAGELYDVFQATGFNDAQSFALLGHAKQESELNPEAWNAREGAGGILQWRGKRLENLKSFAAGRGMNWKDRSVQAAYVRHEMENDPYERKRSARFRGATTIEEASAALHDYVRFGDNSAGTRLGNARGYAESFGANGAPFASKPGRGSANLMKGQYGPAGSNLVTITSAAGANFTVHKEAAPSFKAFVDELEGTGYRIDPKTSGGYNYRTKRGGMGLSQHAYGNAIDINPQSNPFTTRLITDLPPNVSDMAAKHGLSWGGDWKRRKDAMHFEWTGQKADPAAVAAARERMLGPADGFDDDGWAKSTKASRPVPSWKSLTGAKGRGGIGSDAAASAPAPQVVVHQNFAGTDPGLQARRAQREQGRAIRMAEARALHDTQVPIA